jgi:hypothetical protein
VKTAASKNVLKIGEILKRYETPRLAKGQFRKGQRVFIDRLGLAGTILRNRGYDPFIGETIYDLVLDSTKKEVSWTEKHLKRV